MFGASKTNSASTGGYTVSNSLRLRASNSAYLNRTPASVGNRKTWTLSTWVKRGNLSSGDKVIFEAGSSTPWFIIGFADSSDKFFINFNAGNSGPNLLTTQVFRDPSAWYHVVLAVDTTQATSTNRIKLYINGLQVTAFDTANYPIQNYDTQVNYTQTHYFCRNQQDNSYFDGYLSEVIFIDGQQLTPSSFGATNATTGVWQPTRYTGTYGTNGFYLPFSDIALTSGSNAGLGKDFSGNSNYWNTNNISVTSGYTYDAMVDVPTLTSTTVANYATLNFLVPSPIGTPTYSDGNLQVVLPARSGVNSQSVSSMVVTSGKWYSEITYQSKSATYYALMIGIVRGNQFATDMQTLGVGYGAYDGHKSVDGVDSTYGASYVTGDIIGIALDLDGGTVTFYKNNSSQGSITLPSSTSGWCVAVGNTTSTGTNTAIANFGQRGFAYTPPSGFKALNTYNLPTPVIGASATTLANKYFIPVIYTGNGSTQSITTGFQPDFVWTKSRSNATPNLLYNSLSGVGKYLVSNNANSEGSNANTITSFNSNGYTLGFDDDSNANGSSSVGWAWKANGSGSSNTSGSITSIVNANTTSGFSIVTYTGNGSAGATVGHGLNKTPAMIIIKSTSINGADWQVFHQNMHNTANPWNWSMYFNSDSSQFGYTGLNNTAPSSSVFTLGSNGGVNQNGSTYVAYCFAEISGYSSFGKYTGNGSSSGPFVYTGFKPAFVMAKSSTSLIHWGIMDSTRDPYNNAGKLLFPDTNIAEENYTSSYPDLMLSNGFKPINTGTVFNESGQTYIFAAFAETPFKYSLAR